MHIDKNRRRSWITRLKIPVSETDLPGVYILDCSKHAPHYWMDFCSFKKAIVTKWIWNGPMVHIYCLMHPSWGRGSGRSPKAKKDYVQNKPYVLNRSGVTKVVLLKEEDIFYLIDLSEFCDAFSEPNLPEFEGYWIRVCRGAGRGEHYTVENLIPAMNLMKL